MTKMLGALTAVGQVIFSDTPGNVPDQTSSLSFQLASRHASNGSYLQAAAVQNGNKNSCDDKKVGWRIEDKKDVYYKENGKIRMGKG